MSLSPCNCWNVDSFLFPSSLPKRQEATDCNTSEGQRSSGHENLIPHSNAHPDTCASLWCYPTISASPDPAILAWDIQSVWYLMERKVLCGRLSDWFLVLPLTRASYMCVDLSTGFLEESDAHFLHLLLRGCFLVFIDSSYVPSLASVIHTALCLCIGWERLHTRLWFFIQC